MAEKQPLYGGDVVPPRLSSGELPQKIELAFFVLVCGLSVAGAAVSIAFMISHHPEHLASAVSSVLSLILFLLVARLYRKDELQDRKIVYLAAFACVAAATSALVYSARWSDGSCSSSAAAPTAAPQSPCPSGFYSQSTGACLSISPAGAYGNLPCYAFQQQALTKLSMSAMSYSPFVTRGVFGANEAKALYSFCFQRANITMGPICNCTFANGEL